MVKRLTVGDSAPIIGLTDVNGNEVALSSLWPNRLTLLSFVRHFG